MLISEKHKFIFVHNYKVAGSSVSRSLESYCEQRRHLPFQAWLKKLGVLPAYYPGRFPWHITAFELKNELKEGFYSYFRFGFVRNPWDWQVSLYEFMLKNTWHKQHRLIKRMKDFNEYLDWRVNFDLELQKNAFYTEEGECLMNFIGKIERLESDFSAVCQQIDIDAELVHINRSRGDHSYLPYYSSATIELVNEAYREDIETFNYKKPELVSLHGNTVV